MVTARRPRRPISPVAGSSTAHRSTEEVPCADDRVLYTPEQAATLLQVRPSWLRRKAAARQIPCSFLGKHLRFSATDLAAVVAAAAEPAAGRRARVRPARPARPPRMST